MASSAKSTSLVRTLSNFGFAQSSTWLKRPTPLPQWRTVLPSDQLRECCESREKKKSERVMARTQLCHTATLIEKGADDDLLCCVKIIIM